MKNFKNLNDPYNLIVFDGRYVSYQYYSAMKRLKNKEGVHTGLYHGFICLVLRLSIKYPTTPLVIAWEGGDLVRKRLIDGYKSNRPKTADSLERQCRNLQEMLRLLGIKQFFAPGYEADDVAANLAKSCERVLLVSGDNDWNQILKKGSAFWRKNKEVPYEKVEEVLGFPPERYALYTLLVGKGSNNFKGIPYFPTMLAKEICTVCADMDSLCEQLYRWKSRFSKWTTHIVSNWDTLCEIYNIIRLKDDVKLEELTCKTNIEKLKVQLIKLQLFKALNLLKEKSKLQRLEK